ncbi:MAG: phosphatidylserine decarboxylase family protein [Bacteroidales bacterium]|nr:phosphatidylserine decarboxylase family protein [Bacteroidales bacterium]
MKIHREGYRIVLLSLALLAVPVLLTYWLCPYRAVGHGVLLLALLLLAFVVRFFRVPSRPFVPSESALYSPADGTVVAIEEVDEGMFLNSRCMQVSVFMSVWNVHINWYPTQGEVVAYKYHPGDFLVARHPKSSTHNERTSVVLKRSDGRQLLVRQIAGFVARRIVCYAKEHQAVQQCDEMGFIKFGSRVDVLLPLEAKVLVELGQKVKGRTSILAEL